MHWFPFYPSDFIGSTLDCSYDEATTYAWMLIVYYQNGGALPGDRVRLYRMLRCESVEQKQLVESVLRFFVERGGQLWHERAERTIAEQNAKHHRRVEAGRSGGEAKASNARALVEQCSSNQNQNQIQNQSQITPKVKTSLSGSSPNGAEHRRLAVQVLEYLNTAAGKNFRPVDSNIRLIVGRLKDGYTPIELKTVVYRQVQMWGTDPKMCEYLRPKTLFNPTNCEQYAGELKEENK
jgi:uncharacterized phage protein (TIGR02220 family)